MTGLPRLRSVVACVSMAAPLVLAAVGAAGDEAIAAMFHHFREPSARGNEAGNSECKRFVENTGERIFPERRDHQQVDPREEGRRFRMPQELSPCILRNPGSQITFITARSAPSDQ